MSVINFLKCQIWTLSFLSSEMLTRFFEYLHQTYLYREDESYNATSSLNDMSYEKRFFIQRINKWRQHLFESTFCISPQN